MLGGTQLTLGAQVLNSFPTISDEPACSFFCCQHNGVGNCQRKWGVFVNKTNHEGETGACFSG